MLTFELRQEYYNRCDPERWLTPDDPRCVDLDAVRADGERARGIDWLERLASSIELKRGPAFVLFSGLSGSGKSTELARLARRLARPDGRNLLPVMVRAEELLDLTAPVDVPDIWIAMLYSADAAVLAAENRTPDPMREGPITRIWNALTRTEVELGRIEGTGSDDIFKTGLPFQLRDNPSVRERVRQAVSKHLTRFLADAREELTRIEERARKVGRAGLVVIFDSLEKLRGTSTNWSAVLQSAERLFSGDAPHLRAPVHTVFTVPPALLLRTTTRVHFLPMLRVRERDGRPSVAGYEVAREVIRHRIPDGILRELLGTTSLEMRLDRLVDASGGYPRDLVRMLQELVASGSDTHTEASFDRVIGDLASEYRRLVTADSVPWLARISERRDFMVDDEAHRVIADRMLRENLVLRYLNHEEWFDLHPALRAHPAIRAAVERLRAAEG